MRAGLRIDVDTWRGTRLGVPDLVQRLACHGIHASFFFTVGPDNMGRHLWRLLNPAFLVKMLRSRAASLYGYDILLRGTIVPGREIGRGLASTIRLAAEAGHEVGFHAWDHHAWQTRLERMSQEEMRAATLAGVERLIEINGAPPVAAACAGWRCNDTVLRAQESFPFHYQSDCRGESIFLPKLDGKVSRRPQIPVTLPTYDEWIGNNGVDDSNYNQRLLDLFDPERLNVLAIHAEVEGVARRELFEDFLTQALSRGVQFVPLGSLLEKRAKLPIASLVDGRIPGRAGSLACQGPTTGSTEADFFSHSS